MRSLKFSTYLILAAAVWPRGLLSAFNRNEYQNMFLGRKARMAHKADNRTPFVNRLYRKYGILEISQPKKPPLPVTGTALMYFTLSV
jgi:hypothetical protein